MKRVPFLVGPTASGKTAVAVLIAEVLPVEIISADSRQIYQGMAIGTSQPNRAELKRVRHHFIACLPPENTFSAGEYGRQAREKIAELLSTGKIPLVVGGSGLYVSAIADDFFTGPSADPDIRKRLRETARREGIQKLYQELLKIDPESAAKILPADYRRIERALEIYHLTGIPISEMRRRKSNPPPFKPVMVGLERQRDALYNRINRRCLQMLDDGLIDEVQRLTSGKDLNDPRLLEDCNALHSVGYVEVIQYLKNDINYDEMVRQFQLHTRRFAKRQISWFRRDNRITWINVAAEETSETVAARVLEIYHRQGIT